MHFSKGHSIFSWLDCLRLTLPPSLHHLEQFPFTCKVVQIKQTLILLSRGLRITPLWKMLPWGTTGKKKNRIPFHSTLAKCRHQREFLQGWGIKVLASPGERSSSERRARMKSADQSLPRCPKAPTPTLLAPPLLFDVFSMTVLAFDSPVLSFLPSILFSFILISSHSVLYIEQGNSLIILKGY